jgi:hypothetical protein
VHRNWGASEPFAGKWLPTKFDFVGKQLNVGIDHVDFVPLFNPACGIGILF